MKVLLVEDDLTLNNLITKCLRKMKYFVEQAYDGEEGFDKYLTNCYDIIILDLNLPYLNGLDLLKKIRKSDKRIKILILTARSSIEDKVMGFNLGATDYLTKPFDLLELEVRINNLLRWKGEQEEEYLNLGKLVLNQQNNSFYYGDHIIGLTRKEFGILEYLMLNKEKYSTAEEIIKQVWEDDASMFSNSFKFHIYQLRKKVESVTESQIQIVSKRNFGYQLFLSNQDNN